MAQDVFKKKRQTARALTENNDEFQIVLKKTTTWYIYRRYICGNNFKKTS